MGIPREYHDPHHLNKVMLPVIRVLNPRTHNTWDEGRYTTYDITIQTKHQAYHLERSVTGRRYSEFTWLKKTLKTHHPSIKPQQFPPKKFFANKFDRCFLEERRKDLEDYLNRVQTECLYLSDVSYHLFVQTDLTTEDIDNYLQGRISDEQINQVWAAGGSNLIHFKKSGYLPSSSSCPDNLYSYGETTQTKENNNDLPPSYSNVMNSSTENSSDNSCETSPEVLPNLNQPKTFNKSRRSSLPAQSMYQRLRFKQLSGGSSFSINSQEENEDE
ncbi:hypothetical protein LOTGIDRAFT_204779 [Lottia gigantea]|uniref:PX domain-containing protein n=1 Tax=Lottia gigantea TaxID=225164 RepID=V4B4Y6_LOTGI|nr:hypothetical protein LOTGIDRAFT_204779 [Lottia gigantea]ESO83504.1 hypothetical protein LOTGIDRAFT_204779 [Lottia gigantea]